MVTEEWPDTLTPQELAAIREDVAKYPKRYDGFRGFEGEGPHDPVVYCRRLLAHLDAITAAVAALPLTLDGGDEWIDRNAVIAILRGEQ